jgi:hypothetical protein
MSDINYPGVLASHLIDDRYKENIGHIPEDVSPIPTSDEIKLEELYKMRYQRILGHATQSLIIN